MVRNKKAKNRNKLPPKRPLEISSYSEPGNLFPEIAQDGVYRWEVEGGPDVINPSVFLLEILAALNLSQLQRLWRQQIWVPWCSCLHLEEGNREGQEVQEFRRLS